jgi:hypothetical protein
MIAKRKKEASDAIEGSGFQLSTGKGCTSAKGRQGRKGASGEHDRKACGRKRFQKKLGIRD